MCFLPTTLRATSTEHTLNGHPAGTKWPRSRSVSFSPQGILENWKHVRIGKKGDTGGEHGDAWTRGTGVAFGRPSRELARGRRGPRSPDHRLREAIRKAAEGCVARAGTSGAHG